MPTIRFDNFQGGMNTSAGRGKLGSAEARLARNVNLRELGKLEPWGSLTSLFDAGAPVLAFHRYESAAGSRLISAKSVGGGASLTIVSRNEATNAETNLATGLTYNENPVFVQFGEKLFLTNKNGRLKVWYGIGNTIDGGFIDAGMISPDDSTLVTSIEPVGTTASGIPNGGLDSTGFEPYSWCFTFYSSTRNIESNPSAWSKAIHATNEIVELEIRVRQGGALFFPAHMDTIRVYRRGGKAGAVGYHAFDFTPTFDASGYYYDAAIGVGTNAADDVPDRDLSTEELSLSNLRPPIGLEILIEHNHRLWGAGPTGGGNTTENPSWAWCSRPDQPEAWGADDNGVDDDGGNLRIDDDVSDPIVQYASVGGVLVVGRRKSLFAILGDGFEGAGRFQSSRRSTIGIASRGSMLRVDNALFWYGTDGELHRFGDADNDTLSHKIRSLLLARPEAQRVRARLESLPGILLAFFPLTGGANAVAYALNLETGAAWWQFDPPGMAAGMTFAAVRSALSPGGLPPHQLLMAFGEDVYAYEDTADAATMNAWAWGSDNLHGGDANVQKTATALRVFGDNSGVAADATVHADGINRTYSLAGGTVTDEGVILDTGLHPDLVGLWLKVDLAGDAEDGTAEITAIELDFEWERVVAR